jgi:hypothetical protein
MGRWLGLGAYTALLYSLLPFGPAIGRAVQSTAAGRFVLGRGAVWIVALGAIAIVVRLRRRAAGARVALAALVGIGYALALGLAPRRPGSSACICRVRHRCVARVARARAVARRSLARLRRGVGAGGGDRLGRRARAGVTPGRFYDVRDIGASARRGARRARARRVARR